LVGATQIAYVYLKEETTMKVDPKTVDFALDMLVAVLSTVRDVALKHHSEDARPE
jgi:hypothetical protein